MLPDAADDSDACMLSLNTGMQETARVSSRLLAWSLGPCTRSCITRALIHQLD